jgi:hypothetical protein
LWAMLAKQVCVVGFDTVIRCREDGGG